MFLNLSIVCQLKVNNCIAMYRRTVHGMFVGPSL